jgi:hypothetical protein
MLNVVKHLSGVAAAEDSSRVTECVGLPPSWKFGNPLGDFQEGSMRQPDTYLKGDREYEFMDSERLRV